MREIDINADVGESFGIYEIGADAELLPLVTSANVACGFHAGDPGTMRRTIELALELGVAVGAHPGLPDLAGFGRRRMDVTPAEVADLVTYQIGALDAFVRGAGGRLRHVKPHGALYNMAAADDELAAAVADAVSRYDSDLILFGLAHSKSIEAAARLGLRTASEVFADRTYRPDGSLTPRREANAMIHDADEAARCVVRMVHEGVVDSTTGTHVAIRADTVCIHGDTLGAHVLARHMRRALDSANITVRAPHSRDAGR